MVALDERPRFNDRRRSKIVCMADNLPQMKAASRAGADIVQIVLEDGVSDDRKDLGLERCVEALAWDWGGSERWVKINCPDSGRFSSDIVALVPSRPEAVVFPKVTGAQDVKMLAALLDEVERASAVPVGSTRISCSIEQALGLAHVEEIALAHPRVCALQLGLFDLGRDLRYRLDMTGPSIETLYAKGRTVLAARVAGVDVGDFAYPVPHDLGGAQTSILRSIQLGFDHKACYEVPQVALINKLYDDARELDEANDYVAAKAKLGEDSDG